MRCSPRASRRWLVRRDRRPARQSVLVLAAHCRGAGHQIFLAALFTAQRPTSPRPCGYVPAFPAPVPTRNSARCNGPLDRRRAGIADTWRAFWRSVRRGQPVVVSNQGPSAPSRLVRISGSLDVRASSVHDVKKLRESLRVHAPIVGAAVPRTSAHQVLNMTRARQLLLRCCRRHRALGQSTHICAFCRTRTACSPALWPVPSKNRPAPRRRMAPPVSCKHQSG